MEITDNQKDIYYAKRCPYCGSGTRITNQFEIYGKSYSNRDVIVCLNYPKCDSFVGTHDGGKPLGRLANKELREAKKKAHHYFDMLWKQKHMERSEAYSRLGNYLQIPQKYVHIGMFNVETCNKVIEFSKNELMNI